jgi:pantothenate kinase
VLVDRELLDRKGAPETFDAQGFTDLLRRLRGSRRPVSCPGFDRTLDEPVADAVVVGADQRVVIVEGNYLLLDAEPWRAGHGVLDAVAYLDAPEAVRIERLIARHVEFGRSPGDAAAFVLASDMANARLVEAGRSRADLLIGSPVV